MGGRDNDDALATSSGAPSTSSVHHHEEKKGRLATALASWQMELLILLLVVLDLFCLSTEIGIDQHLLCIAGQVLPASPDMLAELSAAHALEHGDDHGHAEQDQHSSGHSAHAHKSSHGVAHKGHGHATAHHDLLIKERVGLSKALAVATPIFLQQATESQGTIWRTIEMGLSKAFAEDPRQACQEVCEGQGTICATNCEVEMHRCHDHNRTVPSGRAKYNECTDQVLASHDQRPPTEAPTEAPAAAHGASHGGHHAVDKSLVCDTKWGPNAHALEHSCHQASILILSLMLVELLIKMALDFHHFVSNPLEMLDLVVVTISLIVDIWIIPSLQTSEEKRNADGVLFLLVMCRFWRVVRIFHGVFEIGHKQHEKVDHMKHRIARLESAIQDLGGEVPPVAKHSKRSVTQS